MAGSNSIQTGDWLLEFAALDLERLTDARRRRITSKLVALVYGGGIGPRTLTEQDIVAAQRELGGFLNAIAHRRQYRVHSREGRRLSVTFAPLVDTKHPRRAPESHRDRGPRLTLVQAIGGDLAVSLLQRAANILQQIGADRLMACPWTPRDGRPCDVLFLARSRKLYCDIKHAKAAAYRNSLDEKKGDK